MLFLLIKTITEHYKQNRKDLVINYVPRRPNGIPAHTKRVDGKTGRCKF